MGQSQSTQTGRAVPYDYSHFSANSLPDRNEAVASVSSTSTVDQAAHTDSTLTRRSPRTPLAIRRHEPVPAGGAVTHTTHNGLETGPLSYVRHRCESESTTSSTVPTASSALPADTSVPTVTEYSDLDTLTDLELDFIQSTLDYPRIKTYSPDPTKMDLHISRYDSKNKPGEQSHSRFGAKSKSGGKKAEKKSKKVGRRASESSSLVSESSAQSSRPGDKASKIRRVKSNEMKGRPILGRADQKNSLANRWGHMVDEYQDTYIDQNEQSQRSAAVRDERKVSKISDHGKYDKVRQVFNKGYALPMQTAPPGLRVEDIETESAPSETSARSWSAMDHHGRSMSVSPAARRSREAGARSRALSLSPDRRPREMALRTGSGEHVSSASAHQHFSRQPEVRRHGGGMRSSELLHQSHMVRQEHSTSGGAASTGAATSRSDQQHDRQQSSVVTKEQTQVKKSSKKKEGVQDRATDIVDTVIENALKMLYGSPRSKRKSAAGSALSAKHMHNENISKNVHNVHNVHNSENISRNVHSSENISKNVHNQSAARKDRAARDAHGQNFSRNVHNENISRNLHSQHQNQNISRKTSSVTDSSMYRVEDYGAAWEQAISRANRLASHSNASMVEQYPRRQSQIKVVPGSGQRRPSQAVGLQGGYMQRLESLSQTSLSPGAHRGSSFSLDAPPYSPRTDQVGGTDYTDKADFSTTLEIRKKPEQAEYSTPDPPQKSKHDQPLPPTLTRGTVTRVLHDGGAGVPGATQFIAGLRSQSQPSLSADYTTSKGTSVSDRPGIVPLPSSPLPSATVITTATTTADNMYAYQPHSHTLDSHTLDSHTLDSHKVTHNGPKSQHYMSLTLPATSTSRPQPEVIDLPPIAEVDETGYGVFSNEPIIVAGLMKGRPPVTRTTQVDTNTKLYNMQPSAINMSKQQQLNFYVFNQGQGQGQGQVQDQGQPQPSRLITDYSTHGRVEYMDNVCESSSDSETELREVTLYHKQTQTASPAGPPARKPRRERRPAPAPPVVTRSKPSHKETTHYITQQTEIEKLPLERAPQANISVQTDALPEPSPPPPPLPPRPQQRRQRSLSPVPRPIFTETRKVEQYRDVRSPSPEVEPRGIDIPMIVQSTPEIVVGEVVPSSDSSEEEILETVEIEEKEQRIAMTIFEEVEFQVQRTQGGKTMKQSANGLDIEPFWLPDKFEAVVDRRKQKITQVRETAKEDQHNKWMEHGNHVPALECTPESSSGPKVMEDRTMTRSSLVTDNNVTEEPIQTQESHDYRLESPSGGGDELFRESTSKTFSKTIPVIGPESGDNPRYTTSHTVFLDPGSRGSHSLGSEYRGHPKPRMSLAESKDRRHHHHHHQHHEHSQPQPRMSLSQSKMRRHQSTDSDTADSARGTDTELDKFSFITGKTSSGHRKETVTSNSTTYPAAANSTAYPATTKTSKYRKVSQYEPENVSFGKRAGQELLREADEVAFDLNEILQSAERASQSGSVYGENEALLTGKLSGLDNQVVHCSQTEPQLKTRIEKDEEGNLVKITEMEHRLTKTVEYPGDEGQGQTEVVSGSRGQRVRRNSSSSSYRTETGSVSGQQTSVSPPRYSGLEVVGETTVGLKPYEYGIQRKSMRVSEDDALPVQHQYLYDLTTAELKPVHTRDSDYNLVQYALGDTMMTQL